MPPAWSTIRIRSTPALRRLAPATTPAMPPPTMTTSTSSTRGSRSIRGVNGSARKRAKCSSRVRSRMAARPGTSRLSRSARYLAWTASRSGSSPPTDSECDTDVRRAATPTGRSGRGGPAATRVGEEAAVDHGRQRGEHHVVVDVEVARGDEVGEALDHGQQRRCGHLRVRAVRGAALRQPLHEGAGDVGEGAPAEATQRPVDGLVLHPRPDHRPVAPVGGEEAGQPRAELLEALRPGADGTELRRQRRHLLGALDGEGAEQVLLVGEVEVEGAVRRARPAHDVVHAGGVVALVREDDGGRVEEALAGAPALGAEHAAGGPSDGDRCLRAPGVGHPSCSFSPATVSGQGKTPQDGRSPARTLPSPGRTRGGCRSAMEREDFGGRIGRYHWESQPWWPTEPAPPPGAPNVVVVLLDDVGFAQLGCFGSDIATPTFDRLAAGGLRYANFHTTALCSPTRACVLTGRNHHSCGMGRIIELASGFPGYDARIPD